MKGNIVKPFRRDTAFVDSKKDRNEIVEYLQAARLHAFAPQSNYLVAALIEVPLDNRFYYVSGVNVEDPENNRQATHAEQGGFSNMISYFGRNVKASRVWYTAAPRNASPEMYDLCLMDSKQEKEDENIKSCRVYVKKIGRYPSEYLEYSVRDVDKTKVHRGRIAKTELGVLGALGVYKFKEGSELIEQCKSSPERYDLCLMDSEQEKKDENIKSDKIYIKKTGEYPFEYLEYAFRDIDKTKVHRGRIAKIKLGLSEKYMFKEGSEFIKQCKSLFDDIPVFDKILSIVSEKGHVPRAAKSCGHCRQLIVSLTIPGAKIYALTLGGIFPTKPDTPESLLPESFSERDLILPPLSQSPSSIYHTDQKSPALFHSQKFRAWDILDKTELTHEQIRSYLRVLSPHIINPDFRPSPVTACLVECSIEYTKVGYGVGVDMQDVAYLTTDAFTAVRQNLISRFGRQGLRFDKIHLVSNLLESDQLPVTAIQMLIGPWRHFVGGKKYIEGEPFVHAKTMVHFYKLDGTSDNYRSYSFIECMEASFKSMKQQLGKNFLKQDLERNALTSLSKL